MSASTPKVTTPASDTAETLKEVNLPRDSGSHADVFAAVGLAALLEDAARDRGVRIVNDGTVFRVVLSQPRPFAELSAISHDPGYSYLRVPAKGQTPPPPRGVTDHIDYVATRDQVNAVRKQEEELYAAAKRAKQPVDPEALEQLQKQWPMDRGKWRRYPVYLTLQGHETANKVHVAITQLPGKAFQTLVLGALKALAAGRPSGVNWSVSTVQLFSPLAAKGYARLKPDSTGRGDKTKDAWADPFVEWLRYRGYFQSAVPLFHGKNGEHIRLLCPVPGNVTPAVYRAIVSAVRSPSRGAGPPKIDVLATLNLARVLIARSEEYHRPDLEPFEGLTINARTPAEIISGLAVTNYQSLGQARAVSTMAELAVPGWFRIESQQHADEWLEILDEHGAIVRGLEDDHSDEFALLQGYRRFLQSRGVVALDALLDFAGAYGSFVIRAREANRRVRQFGTDHLRRVVGSMSSDYAAILNDEGFRAVATAVRRATVSAQSLKARGVDHREIRYGLLPDLRRARELPGNEPLLLAVAEFVSLYNTENARREEATGRAWHRRVTTEELAAFTRLVDDARKGASIVGALLCAYGTCTDRREPDAAEPDAPISTDVTDADDGENV